MLPESTASHETCAPISIESSHGIHIVLEYTIRSGNATGSMAGCWMEFRERHRMEPQNISRISL